MRVVPRVPPFDRPATYEDLEKLPPEMVADIVDGELRAGAGASLKTRARAAALHRPGGKGSSSASSHAFQ